ncbi:MAG: hypothetical protein ABI763_11680 [Bacteroidota bacterium]
MRKSRRQTQVPKTKMRIRMMVITGSLCLMFALTLGWLVFLNLSQNTRTSASNSEMGGAILNNGEIISNFTWEKDPATKSTLGPDAIKISNTAHTAFGGRSSTGGLAPGLPAQDINMVLANSPLFDVEGIDVSVDFKRREPSGSFITRGKSIDFGFKKGFINISYRTIGLKGGFETVTATTDYEIPMDEQFRNYRFIYTPTTGKGELFVNSVVIWSNDGNKNSAMYWNDAGNIIIAKDIDGGGKDIPVLDNFVMRTTGSVSPLAESLINFMLIPSGNDIHVHWSSTANEKVDYFTIERSVNGVDFANLTNIPADLTIQEGDEYVYTDKSVNSPGIVFYRMRQTFKDGKFITHATSAIKIKTDKALTIDRIYPPTFQNSFNLAYFIPSSGRVWVQLIDEQGKIQCSETFEAPQGKNVYTFKDRKNMNTGTYTLNLVFDDKKVTAKVTKV